MSAYTPGAQPVPLMLEAVTLVAAAYVIGGLPTAYLLVRLLRGVDIRTIGSGNVGATNAMRAGGVWLGIAVFLVDAAKGAIPVGMAQHLFSGPEAAWVVAVTMLAAVSGHVFSVFLRFSGGKGVATAAGAMLAAAPVGALWCFGLFAAVVAATRYVSVGSILACGLFAVLAIAGVVFPSYPLAVRLLVCSVPALIVLRHVGNIRRIIAGTEHRVGARAR